MDRLDRMPRSTDDIVNKTPIVVGTDTPKGYKGIRTTIQIRDLRFKNTDDHENEFRLDAVINTEIREGKTFFNQSQSEQQTMKYHRELAELLLVAVATAAAKEKIGIE